MDRALASIPIPPITCRSRPRSFPEAPRPRTPRGGPRWLRVFDPQPHRRQRQPLARCHSRGHRPAFAARRPRVLRIQARPARARHRLPPAAPPRARFRRLHAEVKRLEELDPVLEHEIKALAYDERLSSRIIGKVDPESSSANTCRTRFSAYRGDLARALRAGAGRGHARRRASFRGRAAGAAAPALPGLRAPLRLPRDQGALAGGDITVADIGCHTLGYLEPYKMGRVLLSMGHSTSTASGLALFNDERRCSLIGDSTFFHAGFRASSTPYSIRTTITLVVMKTARRP